MTFSTILFGSVFCAAQTEMTAKELFKRLDSNGDGIITENEMLDAHYTMRHVGPQCKIPMTYSFVGNWSVDEIALCENEKDIHEEEMKKRASREHKYHTIDDDYYRPSSYQRGRDSMVSDIVETAAVYVIADTVFSAVLENKD